MDRDPTFAEVPVDGAATDVNSVVCMGRSRELTYESWFSYGRALCSANHGGRRREPLLSGEPNPMSSPFLIGCVAPPMHVSFDRTAAADPRVRIERTLHDGNLDAALALLRRCHGYYLL